MKESNFNLFEKKIDDVTSDLLFEHDVCKKVYLFEGVYLYDIDLDKVVLKLEHFIQEIEMLKDK